MRKEVAEWLRDQAMTAGVEVPENVQQALERPEELAPIKVQIAALFILRATYGQIMTLFNVNSSRVYDATIRLPRGIREMRGTTGGRKLMISNEQASLYHSLLPMAWENEDPIKLAAEIQQLAAGKDADE